MTRIVGAYAFSHAPQILAQPDFGEEYKAKLKKIQEALMEVGRRIQRAAPDAILLLGSDHLESFFLHNYPQLLIFTGPEIAGSYAGYTLKLNCYPDLARDMLFSLVQDGYDLSFSQEMALDHPYVSPMAWVTKTSNGSRYIPFHINSNVAPKVNPSRCLELGRSIRKFFDGYSAIDKVAILATGGLSHFPGTPKYGTVDTEADNEILQIIKDGKCTKLAKFTDDWLDNAGEFEVRTWMTAAGAVGDVPGEIIAYERMWHIGMCVASFGA